MTHVLDETWGIAFTPDGFRQLPVMSAHIHQNSAHLSHAWQGHGGFIEAKHMSHSQCGFVQFLAAFYTCSHTNAPPPHTCTHVSSITVIHSRCQSLYGVITNHIDTDIQRHTQKGDTKAQTDRQTNTQAPAVCASQCVSCLYSDLPKTYFSRREVDCYMFFFRHLIT